jgi:hypothetical protein
VRQRDAILGYRVANIEELAVLDEAGQVVGAYNADSRSSRAQKNLPQ